MDKLTGTLVYVQVDTPKPCYVESKGKEWKCSIVVDEDTADAWDEMFPKQTAKQVKTADFTKIYKIDPPYPDQRKQYIITLRKNTKLANGNDVPEKYQPKVFKKEGGSIVNITKDILVANGSEGVVSVEVYEGKMGTFARLKNVLVTNLIEYVKENKGGGEAGDEFGLPVKQETNEFSEESKQEPKKSSTKNAPKVEPEPEPEDEDDSDDPF